MKAKKMKNFPLFLKEDAFLVFSRMAEADQKDQVAVLAKLKQSFSLTKAQAYARFTSQTLCMDECPDAYVADLQRLSTLAGHKADDDADPLIVEQLIARLLVDFARGLRLAKTGKELSVTGCLDEVQTLKTAATYHRAREQTQVVAVAANEETMACFQCGTSWPHGQALS